MRKLIFSFLLMVLLLGCARPTTTPEVSPTSIPDVVRPAAATEANASSAPDTSAGPLWPIPEWQTGTPESQGLDAAMLERMQNDIKSSGLALDSLLILRNGVIVSESYYNGTQANDLHMMYSVTKSFISTLIGIASDQGKIRIDQTVADLLPGRTFENPDPLKESMTVENLLTMSSGLDWVEGDSSYSALFRSPDWAQWVLDLPLVTAPGMTFRYCSGCSHVLSTMLYDIVGDEKAFAEENLFQPLGIHNYTWETDSQGIPNGGWGLNLTPRDMAKLGYLYLHGGQWADQQVISSNWVAAATAEHIHTQGREGYGYQWWTYTAHHAYAALGRGGQTIYVIPDLNVIVVTTANLNSDHDPIYNLINNYIIPAVVK